LSFEDHLANWFFLEHLLENTTIFVACSRYLELGIFDDATLALEEIAPEDKTRSEVLGARVAIYLAAEKWDMAVAVANHLVKIEPENSGWWINLAYATRRCEGIESAEAILLRARELHHDKKTRERTELAFIEPMQCKPLARRCRRARSGPSRSSSRAIAASS
jgi:lipopolysaccharide biosynthesis regulator YciM